MQVKEIETEEILARAWLRARRAEIKNRAELQAQLEQVLCSLPHLSGSPRTVGMYSPMDGEACPHALAEAVHDRGGRTAYPLMNGLALAYHLAAPSELSVDAYGFWEPSRAAPVAPLEEVDLFLVPGFGFTPRGERLGSGRGDYQRALAEARRKRKGPSAPVLGVGFFVQVVDHLPIDPTVDLRMDGLVTERGYVPCQGDSTRRQGP